MRLEEKKDKKITVDASPANPETPGVLLLAWTVDGEASRRAVLRDKGEPVGVPGLAQL